MNNDFSFVAYSHSSYSDLWEPFFDRLQKHLPFQFEKYYFFVDEIPENMKEIVPDNFEMIAYDNNASYGCEIGDKSLLERILLNLLNSNF